MFPHDVTLTYDVSDNFPPYDPIRLPESLENSYPRARGQRRDARPACTHGYVRGGTYYAATTTWARSGPAWHPRWRRCSPPPGRRPRQVNKMWQLEIKHANEEGTLDDGCI